MASSYSSDWGIVLKAEKKYLIQSLWQIFEEKLRDVSGNNVPTQNPAETEFHGVLSFKVPVCSNYILTALTKAPHILVVYSLVPLLEAKDTVQFMKMSIVQLSKHLICQTESIINSFL